MLINITYCCFNTLGTMRLIGGPHYILMSNCTEKHFFLLPRSMIPGTGSHGILQERCGKVTGSCRKTLEIAGKWQQYSDRKSSGFFLVNSCAFRQEPAGNHQKKSENFPAGILLPQNHRNYPEPVISGPACSTWVDIYI